MMILQMYAFGKGKQNFVVQLAFLAIKIVANSTE